MLSNILSVHCVDASVRNKWNPCQSGKCVKLQQTEMYYVVLHFNALNQPGVKVSTFTKAYRIGIFFAGLSPFHSERLCAALDEHEFRLLYQQMAASQKRMLGLWEKKVDRPFSVLQFLPWRVILTEYAAFKLPSMRFYQLHFHYCSLLSFGCIS